MASVCLRALAEHEHGHGTVSGAVNLACSQACYSKRLGVLLTLVASVLQDVLLVMYLANLVQTHVALADKLGTMSLPLV